MDRMKNLTREEKLALVQRSLGLKHKLKVHDSMEAPSTHEDLSATLVAKWELEDELQAIEELITHFREANVAKKREEIKKKYLQSSKSKKSSPKQEEHDEQEDPSEEDS